MAFELDLTCIKIKWYTKFQINMSKHKACRRKVRKTVTDGRTETRTDGRTDGHHHTIIRPVWRRAYKNTMICLSEILFSNYNQHYGIKLKKPIRNTPPPPPKKKQKNKQTKSRSYCNLNHTHLITSNIIYSYIHISKPTFLSVILYHKTVNIEYVLGDWNLLSFAVHKVHFYNKRNVINTHI